MSKEPRAVTLSMVAKTAGVDLSTVSRVINSTDADARRWASAATIERIRQAATASGYQRNPQAASLRTRRSGLVGVLVPRLQDYVLATIYEGIEEAAIEHKLSTFVTNSLDKPSNQVARTEMMLARRVEGLIFGDAHLDDPFLDDLADRGIKLVLVSRHSGRHVSSTCDDILGGNLAAKHLLATGRKRIAVLAGRPYASTARDRTAGLVDVLQEAGVAVDQRHIIHGGFDAPAGREAAEHLLQIYPEVDAIFATNDFAAIGAMGALRDKGLSVPDDVAVVGYNDTPLAAELAIPLTSIRSPMHEMGRRGLELLTQILEGKDVESVRLAPELVVRTSTQPRSANLLVT